MQFENNESPSKAAPPEDASQAFRQDLPLYQPAAETRQFAAAAADQPQTPQDVRATKLINELNNPNANVGALFDTLRRTFLEEGRTGGVQGMRDLADKVSKGTGLPMSVAPFRGSNRVQALSITDRRERTTEIPLTGR